MSKLFDRLQEWRDAYAKQEIASGKPSFMGNPDEWYEDTHWFCENGHVSGRFLKSEEEGVLCLACRKPVFMGPRMGEQVFGKIIERLKQQA